MKDKKKEGKYVVSTLIDQMTNSVNKEQSANTESSRMEIKQGLQFFMESFLYLRRYSLPGLQIGTGQSSHLFFGSVV